MIRCESLNNLETGVKSRFLSLNYEILLTLTNLAPGSISFPTVIPRFYGPPISEFSSTWFNLYVYCSIESGPKR